MNLSYNIQTYNQISGLQTIDNNTFSRFGTGLGDGCGSTTDAVITNSLHNDDGQMPVLIKNTRLYDVQNQSKVYLFRPNIDKINPWFCVDMDCDGLKKNILSDTDGSFLGNPGSVLSQSEFGWGLQSRGLGDYRIPLEALSFPNGSAMPISNLYTYRGIVRNESLCTYVAAWEAYQCFGMNHRMLIIESMDNDTETRRLSPVAIISDNKYIDLINGPGGKLK